METYQVVPQAIKISLCRGVLVVSLGDRGDGQLIKIARQINFQISSVSYHPVHKSTIYRVFRRSRRRSNVRELPFRGEL